MGNPERKTLLLAHSVHAPPTMVISVVQSVKTVRASSVVTVSDVAETVVAATVTCAMFTVGCGHGQRVVGKMEYQNLHWRLRQDRTPEDEDHPSRKCITHTLNHS